MNKTLAAYFSTSGTTARVAKKLAQNGRSGFSSSDAALREAARGATWLDGARFSVGASAEEVLAWAKELAPFILFR